MGLKSLPRICEALQIRYVLRIKPVLSHGRVVGDRNIHQISDAYHLTRYVLAQILWTSTSPNSCRTHLHGPDTRSSTNVQHSTGIALEWGQVQLATHGNLVSNFSSCRYQDIKGNYTSIILWAMSRRSLSFYRRLGRAIIFRMDQPGTSSFG